MGSSKNMNIDPAGANLLTEEPILTVSALNQTVSRLLEKSFTSIWVSGEISNFTRATSGHWYFTLKDENAQVRAVMFRGRTQALRFNVQNGDKIEARASVTLYSARGEYQLNIETIRKAGTGNLFEAFLRLKEKLAKEGLFDPEKKRPMPFFPKTVGIITSPQAAALRDVLTTLSRRAPHIKIILYPSPVQGDGAAEKLTQAVEKASARAETDVLIICRGGGSIEDLWSFNEEVLARAIYTCTIPVISGVGHETDTTITDFVADLRAPTPTGAAEIVTRPQTEWLKLIQRQAQDLQIAMERMMAAARQNVDIASRSLISPAAYVQREKIRLNALNDRLSNANERKITDIKNQLSHLNTRLKGKTPNTAAYYTLVQTAQKQLETQFHAHLLYYRQKITSFQTQLELLNPQRTLQRGYAIITDKRGKPIRSPAKLPLRDNVTIQLAEGKAQVKFASIQPEIE